MRGDTRALVGPANYSLVEASKTLASLWIPFLAIMAGVGFAIFLFGLANWPFRSSG